MKEINRIMIVAMVAVVATMMPQSVSAQQHLKIGVVNIAELNEKAPQVRQAQQVLQQEFERRRNDLISEQAAIADLQNRLQRDADVLSDAEEAARLERELRNRQRDFQRNAQTFEEDVSIRQNEIMGRIQREIFETIRMFAEEEGFDLMLGQGVIHASGQVNVTAQVLQRLQARGAESGR